MSDHSPEGFTILLNTQRTNNIDGKEINVDWNNRHTIVWRLNLNSFPCLLYPVEDEEPF